MMNKKGYQAALTVLLVVLLANLSGCSKEPGKPSAETQPPMVVRSPSAEKNSFKEVSSQLDAGGDFYLYWGTEQILSQLSTNLAAFESVVQNIPGIDDRVRMMVPGIIEAASALIKESGVEQISGLGMSSIALEKGFHQNKVIVHHYPGKGAGFGWQLMGKQAHPLSGLDFLPATTALAGFGDFDLPLLWTAITKHLDQAGIEDANAAIKALPVAFQAATGIALDQLLHSLGGEYGIILTLDESKQITLPLGQQPLQIPEPGLLLAIKVNDDTIYDRVDKLLATAPMPGALVTRSDTNGIRMTTFALPLPLPVPLRPTLARTKDYLFLATTDTLIQEAIAVSRGQKKGWKGSDEYKRLSKDMPDKGNQFVFISPKLGQTVGRIQQAGMAANPMLNQAQLGPIQNMFGFGGTNFMYAVGGAFDEGWRVVSRGSQGSGKMLMGPALIMPLGLVAAIAIPNFVKARGAAQQNSIINNLRMLDGAKEQWALENRKKVGDVVTDADVAPYIRGGKVSNLQGEVYELNLIGDPPTARLPNGSMITMP